MQRSESLVWRRPARGLWRVNLPDSVSGANNAAQARSAFHSAIGGLDMGENGPTIHFTPSGITASESRLTEMPDDLPPARLSLPLCPARAACLPRRALWRSARTSVEIPS